MKRFWLLLFILLCIIPFNIHALSSDYVDKAGKILNIENDDKVHLYLFHGQECPHCEEERNWLKGIEEDYKDYLTIYYYEVWHDKDNIKLLDDIKKEFEIKSTGVPLTIISDKYYVGYSEPIGDTIENKIQEFAELKNKDNEISIPIIGKVNIKEVSIPLVAVVLGFIDGFNPCAMWILLFLISMLIGLNNKKRAWILGLTFLLVSGLVYFLSMLGINFVIGVVTINWMKVLIAIFILIAGLYNLRKYFNIRKKDVGCTVVDAKKRKKITTKMKNIMNSNSFLFSLGGIILLAASVNLIELACSLGFPVIFSEVLTVNEISGITRIIYLLIYIFFYMIDDMVVFSISMVTLEATGITNKYNKLCTLISAIIMIIMGILLLIKPEWLMLNF